MKHLTLLLVLSVAIATPSVATAQANLIESLITSMVSAGFDMDETDKLRMAKLLASKGVINCQVKEWGRKVETDSMTSAERIKVLENQVRQFDVKVGLVSRQIDKVLGNGKEARTLARNIARDNDMSVIQKEVLPHIEGLVKQVEGQLRDEIEIVRFVAYEYTEKFDTLCKKVDAIEREMNKLREEIVALKNANNSRTVLRPSYENQPTPAPPRPGTGSSGSRQPSSGSSSIHVSKIVNDTSSLCSAAIMIKKCWDYDVVVQENGRNVRRSYHGNLYSSCSGTVLVLHRKTSY